MKNNLKRSSVMNKVTMTILFYGVLTLPSYAQQSVNAAGGEATGSGGSASYSVGQNFYSCYEGMGVTVTPGVQQFDQISKFLAENPITPKVEMLVYPNPATELVNLKIENYKSDHLSYVLYDLQGRQIDINKITQDETQIQMQKLPSAIYILNVLDKDKVLKNFKIIKKTN